MRLLVTGASGCLGRALIAQCRGRHQVVGVDLVEPPEEVAGDDHLEFHVGNAFDEKLFRELAEGCDAVCHTAALHGAHVRTHTLAQFIETNVGGMEMVCRVMSELRIERLAFSSTSEIVVGRDWTASGATLITSATKPCPDSRYSLSKLMAEQVGRYHATHNGLRIACLRYCGFNRTSRYGDYGLGLICRNLDPSDVAEANLKCIESNRFDFEVSYVSPVSPLTAADMATATTDPAKILEKHWPGSVELLASAGRAIDRPLWPRLDVTRLRQITGWEPAYTFDDFLAELKQGKDG